MLTGDRLLREGDRPSPPKPMQSTTAFQTLTSSESSEWYTPKWIFDSVRMVGRIGLDPASNAIAQAWIQADRYYTIEDDGFNREWRSPYGLWLNPPYGTKGKGNYGASEWILKAIANHRAGLYPWAILLVRGDSKGVHALEATAISCEPFDRIAFFSPVDPNKKNPVPGCRFWYLGDDPRHFARAFGAIGVIRAPYNL